MNGGRDEILARIRAQLVGRVPVGRATAEERRAVVPARASQGGVDLIDLFTRRATGVAMTVGRAERVADVPAAAARFAGEARADGEAGADGGRADGGRTDGSAFAVSVPPSLGGLAWRAAGLDATPHPPSPHHRLSVTMAWAGIAETGTCVVRSGSENAHSASVLTRANLIVLETSAVVATMEDVFARVRDAQVPRTLLFVTGPSRTGDIGFRLIVPAQGPARVHILLVGG